MRERIKDKMRLEHIAESIQRLQTYAGDLSEEELETVSCAIMAL